MPYKSREGELPKNDMAMDSAAYVLRDLDRVFDFRDICVTNRVNFAGVRFDTGSGKMRLAVAKKGIKSKLFRDQIAADIQRFHEVVLRDIDPSRVVELGPSAAIPVVQPPECYQIISAPIPFPVAVDKLPVGIETGDFQAPCLPQLLSSVEQPTTESVPQLQARIRFLETQLYADQPYLRLYRVGGLSLFAALISLLSWVVLGIGVPFHPIFAVMTIPVAIGIVIMAFAVRREQPKKAGTRNDEGSVPKSTT